MVPRIGSNKSCNKNRSTRVRIANATTVKEVGRGEVEMMSVDKANETRKFFEKDVSDGKTVLQ